MTGTQTVVIYHAGCADGFTAAWVARKAYPEADFVPAKYGDEPPDVERRHVFVLDFSYDEQTLLEVGSRARSLVVLDHHASAFKRVGHLSCCVFDMERSGARMAWDHFFGGAPVPPLVRYVEDRDLWRWEMPHSRQVNAWIATQRMEWDNWDALDWMLRNKGDVVVEKGDAVLEYQAQQVERICRNARTVVLDGHRVPAVNTSVLQSETGHRLAEGNPFAVMWCQVDDGRYLVSLRSTDGGEDVSAIAEAHGGGGHPPAAGFKCDALPWENGGRS
ncbi:MAG: DHHA1 domain-containing protein [Gemmatimonadota bacterium]